MWLLLGKLFSSQFQNLFFDKSLRPKLGLKLPRPLYYRSFQGDTSVVVLFVLCFGVDYLCCLHLVYVFMFLFKFG